MMTYNFKALPELLFALFVALITWVFQLLLDFNPDTVTDWKTWAIAAAGGLARAIGAAGIAWLGKGLLTGILGVILSLGTVLPLVQVEQAEAIEFKQVYRGWNLVAVHGDDCNSLDAYEDFGVTVIAYFEAETQTWFLWGPDVPEAINGLHLICPGQVVWFRVNSDILLPLP